MRESDSSLVVISDVDGCLLDGEYSSDAASEALEVLRARRIPLVLWSSKTSGELQALQERLGLGGSYRDVVSAVRCAALEAEVNLVLSADMSAVEVAADTGLSLGEAVLAKQREHDEPFRLMASAAARERFERLLAASGVGVAHGGRYDHAVMNADKGRASVAMRHVFLKACGSVTTRKLGDALNDVPLLRSVDRPVVVRGPCEDVTRDVHRMVPWAEVTDAPGPLGWQTAVLKVVDEREGNGRGTGGPPTR
jgi:predicted mannosyl-3-phosphoglycerate phosphatase (HAD superfamily)